MNIESEKIVLRSSDFLQQHGIEVLMGKEVSKNTNNYLLNIYGENGQYHAKLWNYIRSSYWLIVFL